MYVQTAALVTNLAAHFKWGRESSLVWVTTLDKAEPVKGADVSIRDCKGKVVWHGKYGRNGCCRIKNALPSEDALPRCEFNVNYSEVSHALGSLGGGLYVFARTAGDMTFTHSSWQEGIEPWRFQLPTADGSAEDGLIAHTILDRALFRAGETVHMKHIMRVHTTAGFAQVPPEMRPDEIMIEHQGSDQQYRFPLTWHAARRRREHVEDTGKRETGDLSNRARQKRGGRGYYALPQAFKYFPEVRSIPGGRVPRTPDEGDLTGPCRAPYQAEGSER